MIILFYCRMESMKNYEIRKLELRQNILENSTNHEVKSRFK